MLLAWLAQQGADPFGGNILLQYGAIGVLATAGLFATIYLYRRSERQHELEREQWRSMYQGEKDRADRMETTLLALHDRIGGELANKLTEATSSMKEWAETMKRRGDR